MGNSCIDKMLNIENYLKRCQIIKDKDVRKIVIEQDKYDIIKLNRRFC